jgi:hypothetical protein
MPVWGVRLAFISIPGMAAVVLGKVAVALGYWAPAAPTIYLLCLLLVLLTATVDFVFLLLSTFAPDG